MRYRPDIDRAKGIAILLVVFGHLMADGYPPGNAWYDTAKDIVYSFHMPLFMYLSGYVFALTGKQNIALDIYPSFLRNRAFRLLLPFILLGLLVVGGKYLASFILYVDDPPDSVAGGLSNLVVDTSESPALFIWYVFVLFLYCAVTPFLWRAGLRWPSLVVAGVILYFLPVTDLLYFDRAATYFIFFAIGGLIASREGIAESFHRALPLFLLMFGVALASEWTNTPKEIRLLLCGLASIPAVHGLVQTRMLAQNRILLALGGYAFSIYLLNTIAIGLIKGGYLAIAPFEGAWATFALLLFFVAGTLAPILIRRVTDPVPVLGPMMR